MTIADRFPNTSLIGRVLRAPIRLLHLRRPLRILRGPMKGITWLPRSTNAGVWFGTYERPTMERIAAALERSAVFYDIGANVGAYTLLAAARGARVMAFEPVPANVAQLALHVRLNAFDQVKIFDLALSNREGHVQFSTAAGLAQGRICSRGDLNVIARELDSLVIEYRLKMPAVIKVDVEGDAGAVFEGALRTILTAKPKIFCAIHDESERNLARAFLDSLDYEIEPYGPIDPRIGMSNSWYCTPR